MFSGEGAESGEMKGKMVKTPQDLLELMKDKEALANYKGMILNGDIQKMAKVNEFEMNLPYTLLADFVRKEGEGIRAKVKDNSEFRWEHVGSTSIPGMPGTWNPDALIVVPSFPPAESVLQAVMDQGYAFNLTSPLDPEDLWFFKFIAEEGVCKDRVMTIHLVKEGGKAGEVLQGMRDRCRSDLWAFNDYKNAKLKAIEDAKGNFFAYKMGKGRNSTVLDNLRKEFNVVMNEEKMTLPPKQPKQ